MTLYIAHVCLNSKLKPIKKGYKPGQTDKRTTKIQHPDYCDNGFIDIAPLGATTEQCWKYCDICVNEKGYPVITEPPEINKKISDRMNKTQADKRLRKG